MIIQKIFNNYCGMFLALAASLCAMERETPNLFTKRVLPIKGRVEAIADNENVVVCSESTWNGPELYAYDINPDLSYEKQRLIIGKRGPMCLSPDGFYMAVYRPKKSEILLYSTAGNYFRKFFAGAQFEEIAFLNNELLVGIDCSKVYEHTVSDDGKPFRECIARHRPDCFRTIGKRSLLRIDDATIVCPDGKWGKSPIYSFSIFRRGGNTFWKEIGTITLLEKEQLNAHLIAACNGLVLISRRNHKEMVLYRVAEDTITLLKAFTISGSMTRFVDGDIFRSEPGCILMSRCDSPGEESTQSEWYFCEDGARYTQKIDDLKTLYCSRTTPCRAFVFSSYQTDCIDLYGDPDVHYRDTAESRTNVLTALCGLFSMKKRVTLEQTLKRVINKAILDTLDSYARNDGIIWE